MENGTEINQTEYRKLQREIAIAEENTKKFKKEAEKFSSSSSSVAQLGESFQKVGDKSTDMGKKLLPITAGVTAIGTGSVMTASKFESSMSQVQATMGITKDSMSTLNGQSVNTMDSLNDLAKQMGESTSFSASECADAINYLALAGYDTQEMYDTLPAVLNLATAGNIDLASASDMVTDSMSALGLEVSQTDTVVDQMAKTSSKTNTSVSQLGEGILTIGATARTVKGGTAELNTALGILANNGIKGAEGGTHLRNIILSLQNPTDKATESLNKMGVKVYDSQGKMRSMNDILGDMNKSMGDMTEAQKSDLISTIFNKTDLSSVNALLGNTGATWDDLQSSITDSSGAAGQMADTQLDNLQGKLTLLKSALEGLAISVGQVLMPAIKNIVGIIQKAVEWFNQLSPASKKVIVIIGLIAGAIGPLLIVIGKLTTGIGGVLKVTSLLMANPMILMIGGIVLAIAGLVVAFVVLWNKSEAFRQFWIGLWESITGFCKSAIDGIISAFNSLKNFVANIFVTDFTEKFGVLGNVLNAWVQNIRNIYGPIKTIFENIINLVKNVFTGNWKGAWENVKNIFKGIFNSFVGIAKTPLNMVLALINNLIDGINFMVKGINKISFKMPDWDWLPNSVQNKSLGFNIPSIPKIKYFAQGGIMMNDTVFGGNLNTRYIGGEAGAEAIMPLDKLPQLMQEMGYIKPQNINTHVSIDGREFAIATSPYISKELAFGGF